MLKSVEQLVKSANNGVKAKKLGNHRMEQDDKAIRYFYYWTCVCEVDKTTGKVTIDNKGWHTSSTTRAVNSYREYYN